MLLPHDNNPNKNLDLSIVTATWQRPKLASWCVRQRHNQSVGNLKVEHIVVSDGPDAKVRNLSEKWAGVRYFEMENHKEGYWGSRARDLGISKALGEYVCFWDDDNIYLPHALVALYSAAYNNDLGIVQISNQRTGGKIPRNWTGSYKRGQIDTACICLKTEVACQIPWFDEETIGRGEDFRWVSKILEKMGNKNVRFLPINIGVRL